MKRFLVLMMTLVLFAVFAACGKQPMNDNNTTKAVTTEVDDETPKVDSESVSAIYAAFLGQFPAFSTEMYGSLYVEDINGDSYPEIVARPTVLVDGELLTGAAQFMLTYTDKGGLSVVYPEAHSSMGVNFRVSKDNCLYYTDDGHNGGTFPYHSGYVYSVDDTGFFLEGQVFGDDWPEDTDYTDMDLICELDEKYDQIFADKIRAITGSRVFTDCSEMDLPEDVDGYLNDALNIDFSAARQNYTNAQNSLRKAIADAVGEEPKSVYVSDYDRDGTYEAFAVVTSEESEDGFAPGAIWFVDAQGKAQQLEANTYAVEVPEDSYNAPETGILSWTYHDYFQAPVYATSASPTSLWMVQSGSPKKVEMLSETALDVVYETGSVYLLPESRISMLNAFDAVFSDVQVNEETGERYGVGHTWKPYFFYDTPEGIKEYGGVEMQQSDIEKIIGGKEVIALAQKDDRKIESIYYRENGVISFSISEQSEGETHYYCFNTFLAENRLRLLNCELSWGDAESDEFLLEGFYNAAAIPQIATYPKEAL